MLNKYEIFGKSARTGNAIKNCKHVSWSLSKKEEGDHLIILSIFLDKFFEHIVY